MNLALRLVGSSVRWLLGSLDRRETAEPDDDWDVVRGDSRFACAARMFRRVEEPLDGVDPGLAQLLAHNRDRDIELNERLTALADQSAAWRERATDCQDRVVALEPHLHAVQARVEAAEAGGRAYREALTHLEARYVSFVLSESDRLDALLVEANDERDVASVSVARPTDEMDDPWTYKRTPKPRLVWPIQTPRPSDTSASRRPQVALRA